MLVPEKATLRPPDLENLIGTDTGRGTLSHSSIGTQLACLRKYGWAYHEQLEPIERARPLGMGAAFAQALALGDPIAGAALLDRETYDQADYDSVLVDKAIVVAAATLYLERYGGDGVPVGGVLRPRQDEVDVRYEVRREIEYLVRLRSPYTGAYSRTFDLHGRADGIVDHGAYLELIEDKLVGRIDPVSVKKVKLDRQVGLESYALWRITGKPVRVIRYRWVKKPSIKQRQSESVEEFIARLTQDYRERPDFYTHEEQTFRSDDDLLLLEAELWEYAEQRRQAVHSGVWPRNTSSCSDYGGCPFIPLCVGDPDAKHLYRRKEAAHDEIPAPAS
jgi:hypothetical protein